MGVGEGIGEGLNLGLAHHFRGQGLDQRMGQGLEGSMRVRRHEKFFNGQIAVEFIVNPEFDLFGFAFA